MRENRSARLYARQSDGEDVALFEGGNPLPFFWLMLLSRDDVELYCIRMRRLTAAGASPSRATLRLDKLQALMQATSRRPYLEQHFTPWLGLFDDWIYFLQISDFSDMKIHIDLYAVSTYYPDINTFEESLRRALNRPIKRKHKKTSTAHPIAASIWRKTPSPTTADASPP